MDIDTGKPDGTTLTNQEALSYITAVTTKRKDVAPTGVLGVISEALSEVNVNDYENIADSGDKVDAIVADEIQEKGVESFLDVEIKNDAGETLPFTTDDMSFEAGSVILNIDQPQNFVPGAYTLTLDITNPITGEVTHFTQDFTW